MTMMIRTALLALSVAAPLAAQELREADRPRYERNYELLGWALRTALMSGAPADIDVLTEVMRGTPGPVDPAGDWNCRTLKLGGITELTVYGDFRCRITEVGPGHWKLEKLTGSQRTVGDLWQTEGAIEYFGVGHVQDGPAVQYGGLPSDSNAAVYPGQTVAVIGFFEQMGPDRARLMQPDPVLESDYDILYFTR